MYGCVSMWDWESFGWGVLVGAGLTFVVGVAVAYSLKEKIVLGLGSELVGRAVGEASRLLK
ncbi:MAG: hypothetical protein QXM03_12585 [Metallosphaera sp.]|uniref:hypothetical protein n=1 Tax=Metallosphaera sp. TaxID=2020860 RepID=UPI00316212FD